MNRKSLPWWREELGLKTQRDVIFRIRNILNGVHIDSNPGGGGSSGMIGASDTEFLLKVLRHHHQFDRKMGDSGMKHLEVRVNESWNGPSRGIWIVRNDGSEEDISWVKALKPEGKADAKEVVSSAARYEIFPQVHEVHNSAVATTCEICGEEMVRGVSLHVDHLYEFKRLFADFLKVSQLQYSDIAVEDLGLAVRFMDRDLASVWTHFHKENATLRLVHKECNLRRTRSS